MVIRVLSSSHGPGILLVHQMLSPLFLTSFSRVFRTFSTVLSACELSDQSSSISPGVFRHSWRLVRKPDTIL